MLLIKELLGIAARILCLREWGPSEGCAVGGQELKLGLPHGQRGLEENKHPHLLCKKHRDFSFAERVPTVESVHRLSSTGGVSLGEIQLR